MATAYLFLLLGLILIIFSWRSLGRTTGTPREAREAGLPGLEEGPPWPEPEGEGYAVGEQEDEETFPAQAEGPEAAGPPGGSRPHPTFRRYLRDALDASESLPDGRGAEALPLEAIIQAVDSGESLESVARRFGRGKGEIELVLNLRRLRSGSR
ncbi:hypothetical protein [Thermanaeromonas sp. C210]|uniref:hypothetical protein n=1 Tax=Thermanaeromonas sp. C210 TaxID=2731925 RepID=UPI00155D3596|nr:hypothetical protein [Thermanaeromonas sp. C210]GFN24128.1 hypothetical protein TAMC210_24460 [Thermanaeromonas sp. C210]